MNRVDEATLREVVWMAVHLLRGRNALSDEKQDVIARAVVEHFARCGLEVYRSERGLDWRDLEG
jgi:hypothetical protein